MTFKAGDKVRRLTEGRHIRFGVKGKIYTVKDILPDGSLVLNELIDVDVDEAAFELIKPVILPDELFEL